jgi:hypothetical protein
MSPTEYRKIFADSGLKKEAQVRARELAAKATSNTATNISNLNQARAGQQQVRVARAG